MDQEAEFGQIMPIALRTFEVEQVDGVLIRCLLLARDRLTALLSKEREEKLYFHLKILEILFYTDSSPSIYQELATAQFLLHLWCQFTLHAAEGLLP